MALLALGGMELDGFEVPAAVQFGGAQRTCVHKLLGGGRVVDSMGPDDSPLRWRGTLSGSDAAVRARMLDAMRSAGSVLALSWDSFSYAVVITSLELGFQNPWWITYEIACTVVSSATQDATQALPDAASVVLGDITLAGTYLDVSNVLDGASVPGALAEGAPSVGVAIAGLQSVKLTASGLLTSAEAGMDGQDVGGLVQSAGAMAQTVYARGFLDRAETNLAGLLS